MLWRSFTEPYQIMLHFQQLKGQWERCTTVGSEFWGLLVICRAKIFWSYWLNPISFLRKLHSLAGMWNFSIIGMLLYTCCILISLVGPKWVTQFVNLKCSYQNKNTNLFANGMFAFELLLIMSAMPNYGHNPLSALCCWLRTSFTSLQPTMCLPYETEI